MIQQRVLRYADYPVTQWKNGGGETRQIAVSPAGSDMDSFDWRLSIASVAQDGPFSIFDQIDRTLHVLAGQGIELALPKGRLERLDKGDTLHGFPADAPLNARLVDGAITDLNIMSRRHQVHHVGYRTDVRGDAAMHLPWSTVALVCLSGTLEACVDGTISKLGALDCLLLEDCQRHCVCLTGYASVFTVGFEVNIVD